MVLLDVLFVASYILKRFLTAATGGGDRVHSVSICIVLPHSFCCDKHFLTTVTHNLPQGFGRLTFKVQVIYWVIGCHVVS